MASTVAAAPVSTLAPGYRVVSSPTSAAAPGSPGPATSAISPRGQRSRAPTPPCGRRSDFHGSCGQAGQARPWDGVERGRRDDDEVTVRQPGAPWSEELLVEARQRPRRRSAGPLRRRPASLAAGPAAAGRSPARRARRSPGRHRPGGGGRAASGGDHDGVQPALLLDDLHQRSRAQRGMEATEVEAPDPCLRQPRRQPGPRSAG